WGDKLQVRSMTKGARNAVFTNIVVVSLALLLSCCTNERETKMLLGIIVPNVGEPPDTDAAGKSFACEHYGCYAGTKQSNDCIQYVGSKRSIFASPSSR